ncbi:hypothetical protein GQ42DRAFT_157661 [Ramicandelaber brevisporus]|nr:hypothetical protein GQ42DRAFT_157661 [Ramicandelaber brevisporus]
MNINKLLNPVPNKRPRFDEGTLACDMYWLPTELIAYLITFFHLQLRPTLRLVSKKWYIAYDLYHRHILFDDIAHAGMRIMTRRQLLHGFVKHGHRLRWMFIHTLTLRDILDIEPNFASLIPNVIWLHVVVNDGLSSQQWVRDFIAKLCNMRRMVISEFGFTADEHLAEEMDKAISGLPQITSVSIEDIDIDLDVFPGPNMKARANQIQRLVISVANIDPGMVYSTFEMFKNAKWLGFRGIGSVGVLKEVAEMVINKKNFPKLQILEVHSELDLSHADSIVNEENGTTVTAMDLYLKICSIRRPRCVLRIGFILGACSTSNLTLMEKEREFIINLGKIGAEVLIHIDLTHYTPSGDYDPLTTLFYESAPRFPRLRFLESHVSPTAVTGPRIIEALNNPFLLPHLISGYFYVDGTQSPEWNRSFNPIDPSRGFLFSVIEAQYEDKWRLLNETSGGILPSMFLPDDLGDADDL